MKRLLSIMLPGLRCFAFIASMRIAVLAQTLQSTTVLSTSQSPLMLPGTLTLTAIVNQPVTPGGVATGNVSFTSDGVGLPGTAALKLMPTTQSFPTAPSHAIAQGINSAGLLAIDFGNGKPVLVTGNNYSSGATVSVLPNLGSGLFGGQPIPSAPLTSGFSIDQIASGFFLTKTSKSALVHEQGAYNVLDGSTSSGVLTVHSTLINLNQSLPDSEVISIDDFDGDQFSDVGVLILGDSQLGLSPIVGIALNEGGTPPTAGTFAPFVQAALPTTLPDGTTGNFCVDAITSGKFNPAFNAQLAVLGHFGTCSQTPPANTPSYLVLYAGPTAAPAITPASEVITGTTNVTISDTTPGATIYYTTDGSQPTSSSNVYSGPIQVTATTTINAIAIAAPDAPSVMSSASYTFGTEGLLKVLPAAIRPRLLSPITPAGGSPLVPVGTDQTSIASADFDQDGKADLVIGSTLGEHVQLFHGNGDGTFTAVGAASNTLGAPQVLNINDFNGDGYPDVAMTLGGNGGLTVLLNDGKGNLTAATQPQTTGLLAGITSADFNADGLPDLAVLQAPANAAGTIDTFLSAESSQATLAVLPPSLPAGTHVLVASYPGDTNFLPSTSSNVSEVVTKTTPAISWPPLAAINYLTALSSTQLDAAAIDPNTSAVVTGTFTYSAPPTCPTITLSPPPPPLTTTCVLPPGSQVIAATFAPSDSFSYLSASTQTSIQVNLSNPMGTVNVPQSADPGGQPTVSLTLQPYPFPVKVTITLEFTDSSSNPATSNGSIGFTNLPPSDSPSTVNGQPTDTFTISAGSSAPITPRTIMAGTVAGTIKVVITLTGNGNTTTLAPATVAVAPSVPNIQSAVLNPGTGENIEVVVVASSSTREISAVTFHFTPVAGKTLQTSDFTLTKPSQFSQWFTSPASAANGGSFTYTQPFTLNQDPSVIESVTVTLENGQGSSAPTPAQ
jgi:hypothetical protein